MTHESAAIEQWSDVLTRSQADMQYRYVGASGLRVSCVGMGTWVTIGGQIEDDENSERLLKMAYDSGINLFDTAEVYAGGRAEEILGRTIKKFKWRRSSFVITTKIFWGGRGENERGLSRKHIIEGLSESLQRLQLEYVDIIMAHRPDPHTPMEETVRAMHHVIHNQGRALYWGTSQWSAAEIMEAHATARTHGLIPPSVEEPEYNMFHREQVEGDLVTAFEKMQIGAFTWSPLASGLLTGKYSRDGHVPAGSRASLKGYEWLRSKILTDEWQGRFKKMDDLKSIAKRLNATLPQLAIAWCLANEDVSAVLIGASSPQQLSENIKAVKLRHALTPEIIMEINQLLANKPIGRRDFRSS